jgi:NADPH-dependent 2,4-dienoyl-CoA reductase/sulfur reductase-like enzyme
MLHHLPAILKPVAKEKKVAIIGGGPIGMRAACYAAQRGHKVTLFEKTDFLGGKMKYAAMYPNLWPHERYRQWLVDEVGRRGVEVRLNTEPTPEDLAAEGFEAIIACTGSSEKRPPIQGADATGVIVSEDIYEGRVQPESLGDNVVFVGGGAVATETAMYLAGLGKNVTVLTRQHALMQSQAGPHGVHKQWELIIPELGYGNVASAWAIYDNLKPVYEVNTTAITPKSVTYVDAEGKETTVQADTVIVSGGYRPHTEEALRYSSCTKEFYLAGDCDKRNDDLRRGNFSAYGKAMLL